MSNLATGSGRPKDGDGMTEIELAGVSVRPSSRDECVRHESGWLVGNWRSDRDVGSPHESYDRYSSEMHGPAMNCTCQGW